MNVTRYRRFQKPSVGTHVDRGHPLAAGLVAHWLFGENGGGTVADPAGGYHASGGGGLSWAGGFGAYSGAVGSFNGTTNFLQSTPFAIPLNDHFSLSCWFNQTSGSGRQTILGNSNATGMPQIESNFNGNAQAIGVIKSGTFIGATAASAYPQNQWVHFIYSHNGTADPAVGGGISGAGRIWIDGVPTAVATGSAISFSDTPCNWLLGERISASQLFVGQIGEVSIRNRVLTNEEARWLYAEPFAFLQAPTSRRFFAQPAAVALTCGPTCSVSDTTARVSFRASADTTVAVKYSTASDLSGSTTTGTVSVASATDWTDKIDLSGLTPNTTYSYTILLGGVDQFTAPYPTLKTFPAAGAAASFSFAFGSCTAHTAARVPGGDTIFAALPGTIRFLLHLGDTIYADADVIAGGNNTTLAGFRAFHQEAMAGGDIYSAGWAAFRKKCPVFTIWDDHDLVDNFSTGTGDSRYAPAKQAFREYHARANPDSMTAGELYYSFACGNVGFFVLDGRSFRSFETGTDDGTKTMLGTAQLAALRSWLSVNNSTYRIKFIVTTTTASGYGETTGPDSWGGADDTFQVPTGANGYRTDRNALWDWIDSHGIRGVVFLAGDMHWAGAFRTAYGSRSRYEFLSSPFNQVMLTKNPRTPDAVNGPVLWAYDAAVNAGVVTVDTTVEPPTISYQLYGTSGSLGSGNLTAIDGNKIDAGLPIHRASLLGCGA